MLRNTFFILTFFTVLSLNAQCPVGDVYLNTQTDVENYISNYGTCEVIEGTLFIVGDTSIDISGITAIKRIEGSLIIDSKMTSISNFSNLEYVGGDFKIDQNDLLETIEGINKLHTVNGDFVITQNYNSLKHIKGFDALETIGGNFQISENYVLETISPFDSLLHIGGAFMIRRANALEQIVGFNKLEKIGISFDVSSFDGNLSIEMNNVLVEINGFNALKEVVRNIDIGGNSLLERTTGFINLEKVRNLSFSGSPLLIEIPIFDNLFEVEAIEFRSIGLVNIKGFNNVKSIDGFINLIDNNELTVMDAFNNLNYIAGIEIITNNSLESIKGFNQLTNVEGYFHINLNPSLISLEGLESLIKVSNLDFINDYSFIITDNISLSDCSAICNLLSNNGITGLIEIIGNPSNCSSQSEIEQYCIPDFDKDGILDDDDLDDDNDGILDTVEQNGDIIRDTDMDGFPDYQDLDSDNDGCFDVIEAGFTDDDGNGTLGSLPDTVDGDGLIIGESDGYTALLDSNNNGISDFQEHNILNAGEDGGLELCINNAPVNLFDSLGGTPDTGGVWSPSLSSGTGIFDPSVDAPGIYTYTVTNGVCGSDASEINVTVHQTPNAGEDGGLELCINNAPVNLFDSLGGTPDTVGVWSPSLSSGTGVFDPSVDAPGIYTYTVTNGVCGSDTSEVNIAIHQIPNAGEDGSLEICINSTPVNLFDSLGGTPDLGGTWSPSLSSGTGIFAPSLDVAGVYTYTVTNGVCGSDTSQVNVAIDQLPDAGENGTLELCINNDPINLFDSLSGTPDISGVWSPSLSSGTGIFDPLVDAPGIYTYTVTNGVCGFDASEVNVTVYQLPNAGEDGNLEICINNAPVNLFDSLGGTPDTDGIWSPSLSSGTGIFDPSVDASGVYTYTVINEACGMDNSQISVAITNVEVIQDYNIKITELSNNNWIEITIESNSQYEYSLNNVSFQLSNRFTNLSGGNYVLYAREINGCGVLEIPVSILDYPKYFTPNNDGFNDFWNLKGITNQEYSIFIYDRYGKLLKQLGTFEEGWDGTFNGNVLPSSDYWFRLVFNDGTVKNGHFTLKR